MILRKIIPPVFVILLLLAYLFSLSSTAVQRKMLPRAGETPFVLPVSVLKITSLEFKGLASDFLFLKALTFYGGTLARKERPAVSESEWHWMYEVLDASTDLDPYFYDPYYFANTNFTWEAHMVKETNTLLSKGSRNLSWDWTIPFYMGFNEFYFLHDHAKAFEYLMTASKRQEAPGLLATLAARMAYKGDRTKIAIVFLQETLKKTKDMATRKEIELRMETLRGVLTLEQSVDAYRSKFGKRPKDLSELRERGILGSTPVDPFGGEFYLDTDGSVKTTSDMFMGKK